MIDDCFIHLAWLWNQVRFDYWWYISFAYAWPGCETESGLTYVMNVLILACYVVKCGMPPNMDASFHSKPYQRNWVRLAHALGIVFCHKFRFKYVNVRVRVYGKRKVCPGRDIRASTFFFLLPVSFLRVTQVLCCFCWLIIVLTIVNCLAQDWPVGKQGQPKGYDGV